MEKILTINGIEYIQKAEYDKAKQDVDNIKQLVSHSIAGLNDFLSNQSIAQSNTQTTTKPTKKTDIYSKRNPNLKIRVSGVRKYSIRRVDPKGYLHSNPNDRILQFTIKDVIEIQKLYKSATTKEDLKKWSKKFNIPLDGIYRIIYKIDENIFAPFMKEYLSQANDIQIKPKKIETQNNPEKRKELGLRS